MKTTWILTLLALAPACQNPAAPEDGAAHLATALPSTGPGAVVTGTVLDARTGKPLRGALIRGPGGVEAKSDASGRFVLRGLALGSQGELVATTEGGLQGKNRLRPLEGGVLEVVVHVR
jgi:hypothetical protein